MKHVIERINKRTTEYAHPSQATTTANALELLSSGIYTEEERFIFELLQNAVDSYNAQRQKILSIKIVLTDNLLVFMHNGTSFSGRDLEGLCDIGNGNKMTDVKKIGYKGIGFKSVFMHSHRVTILTDNTCFKFDKEECESIAKSKGQDYDNVKMPWQIIPIVSEKPNGINVDGFNVVTYIEITNRISLKKKVEKLLSDTRFLLFLKVEDLRISFLDENEEILSLAKKQSNDVLTLSKNGITQNHWLIASNEVILTPEIKEALVHDSKTPTKLKDSDSVEISFAIALNEKNEILPLEHAVIYTYLPTSFSFGLNFIVNSNFITDAGRQQIIKDCAWNEFIFSQIPNLYLNWLSDYVTSTYAEWYKVLPSFSSADDELSNTFNAALKKAIDDIPFVRTLDNRMVLVKNAVDDNINLHQAVPCNVFNIFVSTEVSEDVTSASLVDNEVGKSLVQYDIATISNNHIYVLLDKSDVYLKSLSDDDFFSFLRWLMNCAENTNKNFIRVLSESKLLLDENASFIMPVASFFPSEYSSQNPDIAEDAKIIRLSLFEKFDDEMIIWLKTLGVQEMSNLSVVKTVICKEGYVNKENAIKVMQFIYDSEKKEPILENLYNSEIKTIKVLARNGNLDNADNLFLDSAYDIKINADNSMLSDYFVSTQYIRRFDDISTWQYLFKRIGVNTNISVRKRKFENNTPLYKMFQSYTDFCAANEDNYGYRIHRDGYFVHIYIQAQLPPILNFQSDNYIYCKFIWSNAMANPLQLDSSEDFIAGHTGWNNYAHGYFKDKNSKHDYLGELVLPYLLRTKNLLPGTDGKLHQSSGLLAPTDLNFETFGHYLPTLNIDCELDSSWYEYVSFKTKFSLVDYLSVLTAISQDTLNIVDNKNRINLIYERISDEFIFVNGGSDYTIICNWGASNKILNKEGKFILPSKAYLLSSRLSGVDLDNQVFHSRHTENERFAQMMIAMGVNMIDNHRVEGLDGAILKPEINTVLYNKACFFTSIIDESLTHESWIKTKSTLENAINKLEFYQTDAINIYYGNQEFPRTTYVENNKFYFVEKFSMANQELLHGSIMEALGLPKKARTLFLTILQMTDLSEIKEYLEQKGYETKFIENTALIELNETSSAIMGISNNSMTGLSEEKMRSYLMEAKDATLEALEYSGYDTSKAIWDNWTCIDGVTKNGVEFPLVVRSNRSGSSTKINASDWNQLMKPNSMFAVLTSNGVGTMNLHEMLKSKENITIKFSSSNIDKMHHIDEMAHVFAYFNGLQIDFESFVPATIGAWKRFNAPEINSGEVPQATNISLPD